MLLHASIDLMVGIFNPLFTGADAQMYLVMLIIVFVGMGILLPLLTGKELGRKPESAADIRTTEQPAMAR
jgi:cadmium resistance protein CadD (predicted permease)